VASTPSDEESNLNAIHALATRLYRKIVPPKDADGGEATGGYYESAD